MTPHTLRHTYARISVQNGIDVVRLAKLMGHTDKHGRPNVETTRQYLHFKDEELRDAAMQYAPSLD